MAAVQLNFTLRTSSKCKTVHLVGSWDGYSGQLPLSKDSSKSGGWKGTFKFSGSALSPGRRYWYYYIIDGYHASHDPARESTTEPTTGRKLNILDIPAAKGGSSSSSTSASATRGSSSRHTGRPPSNASYGVPKGRALSPSQIQSPLPSKPYATRGIATDKFSNRELEALARQYAAQKISNAASPVSSDASSDSEGYRSGLSSDVPSLRSGSSRTSQSSSPSSMGSCCTCERYAIKRDGSRVKLDCGGKRCGYTSSSSDCSSDSDDPYHRQQGTRRQGVVVRR